MTQEVVLSEQVRKLRFICSCSLVVVLPLAHSDLGQDQVGEVIDVRSGFARLSIESEAAPPQLSDFQVSWKGQPQLVREILGGPGSPIEVGIAIDTSASMVPSFDFMKVAIKEFLRSELSAADRVFVVSISDRLDFQAEGLDDSLTAISSMSPDTRPGVRATRFLDGVESTLLHFRNSSPRAVLLVASDGCDSLRRKDAGDRILKEASDKAIPIVLIAPSRRDCRNMTCKLTPSGQWNCSDEASATPGIAEQERTASGPIRGGVDIRSDPLTSPITIARDKFVGRLKAGGGSVVFARSDSDWVREMDSVRSLLNRQWTVVFEPTSEAVRSSEVRVKVRKGSRKAPSEDNSVEARLAVAQTLEPLQDEAAPIPSTPNPTSAEAELRNSSVISEQVRVEVVNVDVVATDKRGRRIVDLQRTDFRLEVDGKPQTIDYFSRPLGIAAEEEEAQRSSAPGATAGSAGTVFLVLDRTSLEARTLKQVVDSFRVVARSPSSEGKTFVIASFADGPTLHTAGTSEPEEINRALDEVVRAGAEGQLRRLERRQLADEIRAGSRMNMDLLVFQVRALEDLEISRQAKFIAAIQDLVTTSADANELNTLMIATVGFSAEPERYLRDLLGSVAGGAASTQSFSSDGASARNLRILEDLEKLAETLQARRVTSYTLNPATGFNAPSNAEFRTTPRGGAGSPREDQALAESAANVGQLADATGGSKIPIFSDLEKRIEAVALDRQSTYSLGFTTGPEAGLENHKIRVAASRPGVSLRYRTSYRRLSPPEQWQSALAVAARSGIVESAFPIQLQASEVSPMRDDQQRKVTMTLLIPLASLNFQPSGDGSIDESALTVQLAVSDSAGTLSKGSEESVQISVPHASLDRAREDSWSHRTEIVLPVGRVGIGALVVEKSTGIWATTSFTLAGDR